MRWLLILLTISAGCGPTTVRVALTIDASAPPQSSLRISVYDDFGALTLDRAVAPMQLGAKESAASSLLLVVPNDSQPLRVILDGVAGVEGGQRVTTRAHEEERISITLAVAADADADGLPDALDDCPMTADHEQQNRDGAGAGDACGGESPDLGSDGGNAIGFTAELPTHHSLDYGSHDLAARTITFQYDGDSAECSHDGGSTFVDCDTPTSLVWTLDDYASHATLVVRARKAGLPDYLYRYTPEPGLNFYECDQIVAADEDAATFAARIFAGRTLCLAGGVTITGAIEPEHDLRILGVDSDRARITSSGAFTVGIATGTRMPFGTVLANLRLDNSGAGYALELEGGGDNVFSYLDLKAGTMFALYANATETPASHFYDCDFTTQSGPAMVFGNAALLAFIDSRIDGNDAAITSWTNFTGAVSYDGGSINARSATGPAVQINGGALTLTRTTLSNLGTTIDLVAGSLSISDSTVASDTLALHAGPGTSGTLTRTIVDTKAGALLCEMATLELDQATLRRVDQLGSAVAAIVTQNGCTLDSMLDGNHICDENLSGTNQFSQPISGLFSGSLVLAKQVNGGIIDACP